MKRLRNVNGKTTYTYKEISFITMLDVTTRRQSIANPPMEDSYGRLHMNIDVREIKEVVNILHIHPGALPVGGGGAESGPCTEGYLCGQID